MFNPPRTDHSARLGRIPLPPLITGRTKYAWGAAMFAAGAILYLATNHYSITAPCRLPLLWADKAIPFIPETVWIYISEWMFLAVAYLRCRDLVRLNRYFYSYLTLQLVCMVVFLNWPTVYPRELFPLDPANTGAWTYNALNGLRRIDTAVSCCPSLHVAGLYLSISMHVGGLKRDLLVFSLWGTLIAVSTLTTKQHYFIDVIAGLIAAGLIDWIFRRYTTFAQRRSAPKALK